MWSRQLFLLQKYFSGPHSFSFPSKTPVTQMLNISVPSSRSLRSSSFTQVFWFFSLILSNSHWLIMKFTHFLLSSLFWNFLYFHLFMWVKSKTKAQYHVLPNTEGNQVNHKWPDHTVSYQFCSKGLLSPLDKQPSSSQRLGSIPTYPWREGSRFLLDCETTQRKQITSSLRNQGAHHLLITKPASHTVFFDVPKHNLHMILCAMWWLPLGCEYIQLRHCYQSHLSSVFGHLQKPRKGIPPSPTRWREGHWNSLPLLLKAVTALKS